ncbi:hypothetical protein C8J57DRAFT_1254206 [Mycena rebaudengoi]|nr:hypothetical protein C8J57DRAFT_1254206 [Mycena rebaudengoi]
MAGSAEFRSLIFRRERSGYMMGRNNKVAQPPLLPCPKAVHNGWESFTLVQTQGYQARVQQDPKKPARSESQSFPAVRAQQPCFELQARDTKEEQRGSTAQQDEIGRSHLGGSLPIYGKVGGGFPLPQAEPKKLAGSSQRKCPEMGAPTPKQGCLGSFPHKTLYFVPHAALAFRVCTVGVGYVLAWHMDAWGQGGTFGSLLGSMVGSPLGHCGVGRLDHCCAAQLDHCLGAALQDGWIATGEHGWIAALWDS